MAVYSRDVFSGAGARPTSGSAGFTTVDGRKTWARAGFKGTPATGDYFAYTLTFSTGTVTLKARWSSSTTLVLERISTIPGVSNGTATLNTFTSTSTSKPKTTGSLCRMGITVTRGAANALTSIQMFWHARSSASETEQNTFTAFNVAGELTPTAGSWDISGTSFYARRDLQGRTPDGDGDGGLAVGTYDRVQGVAYNDMLQPSEAVMVAIDDDGVCRPDNAFNDNYNILRGVSPPDDQQANLLVQWTSNEAFVFVVCRGTSTTYLYVPGFTGGPDFSGYFVIAIPLSTTIALDIYEVTNNGTTFLDEVEVPFDTDPHTLSIQAVGDQITALYDHVAVLTVTDSTHPSGDMGFGAESASDADPGVGITGFEITDPDVEVETCAFLVSAHEFYDPPRDEVNGQQTDSFPFMGTMVRHPSATAAISGGGSQGVVVGAGRAVYLDEGIEGQVDGVPTPLGDDYCTYLRGTFPQRDGVTIVDRVLIWEDALDDIGTGPLEGRVHNGGTAGIGTYSQEFSGIEDIDGPAVIGDGEGRARQPAGATGLVTNVSAYRISGLTLPVEYDVEIDVYNETQAGSQGSVGLRLRWEPTYYGIAYVWDVFQHQGVGPYNNSYHAHVGNQTAGALTTTNRIGSAGSTKEFETRIRGTNPGFVAVYFGGEPYEPDGIEEISFYDGQFNAPEFPDVAGDIGLQWVGLGAGLDNPLRIAAIRIYEYVTTSSPEYERADAELLVRYDESSDSGFGLRLNFDHTGPAVASTAYIFERTSGVETRCSPSLSVPISHATGFEMRLEVAGTMLTARIGSILLGTFDYGEDLADETAATVTSHDTGDPGLGGSDDSTTGFFMTLDLFEVRNPGVDEDGNPCPGGDCGPIDPPCHGPGGNGTPWPCQPPPGGGDVGYWIKQNLRYRYIPVYIGGVLQPNTAPVSNLLHRPGAIPFPKVNFKYRTLAGSPTDLDPPCYGPNKPETFDPCDELPPIVVPPEVPLGPPPDRWYITWNITVEQLGPLWTAMMLATGPWTPGDIPVAASKGCVIVGNIGAYAKFYRNGQYARDLYLDWVDSCAPFMDYFLEQQALGVVGGQMLADDWNNADLWPPVGLSFAELEYLTQYWKSRYPGIRMWLRARSQEMFEDVPSIDGIVSQIRRTGVRFATQPYEYALQELDWCQSRGKVLILSQNFYQGDTPRTAMTPTQVYDNFTGFYDAVSTHSYGGKCYGWGGWKYESGGSRGDVTTDAYMPSFAHGRNLLQSLGAPS